jgi:myo-inositol-1(or 4)-monophosphatase
VNINSYIWIIDPIDGTTNFVQRHRDYSISIACYKGDFPVFALVYDVMAQELFEAQKGQGAWLNGEKMLPLTGMGYLKNSLVDFSVNGIHTMKKHYNVDLVKLSGSIRGHRALGSASLILCHIARGDTDIYISPKLHIWDYAAGNLILQELGGEVLLYPKDDLLHSPRSSRLLIGTNSSMVLEEFKDYLGLNL